MENRNEGQGFRPLGSLTSKIASSLRASESTPEPRPQSSGITGLPSLRTQQNSIGQRLGALGAVALPSVPEALKGADAYLTDKALIASLPQPVQSRLKSKVNAEYDLIGYELPDVTGLSPQDIALAEQMVIESCIPAPAIAALTEVTKCFAVTQSREHDETDMKATLAGMVDGLAEFPADVIRDACRSYAKWNKWRPALSELRDMCWQRYQARASLRHALLIAAR